MDGINGITSLNVGLWGLTALVVGLTNDIGDLVVIGAVVAGATLGFLPWNAPVAKLFLGDVGSYLLGGLVSAGILLGVAHGAPIALLVAPLSLYAIDTGSVLVKRLLKGNPLLEAHRDHVYQRLVGRAGISHIMVASFTAALAMVITLAWVPGSALLGVLVTLLVVATYLVSPLTMERVVEPHRQRTRVST